MPPVPVPSQRKISRTELWWIFAAVLFGAILRLSFPGRMAIEHFDEGVYAGNFWFENGYPARHLYAPPLLPASIEWTMIAASLLGMRPIGFIPMIPCLIAGIATIPSVWWVSRQWFGPVAGIVSAWLVATSDFHASYSRAALTDVPVCLFILWGVYFASQAITSGARRDILLAGLLTGLAWWTKYSGWLPIAITVAGTAAWQWTIPDPMRKRLPYAYRCLMLSGVAFIVWSPVLYSLQDVGGYAAVTANHRQYLVGLDQWLAVATQQLIHVGTYENWLGSTFELGRSTSRVLMPFYLAVPILLVIASGYGCTVWILRTWRTPQSLQAWLTLAWICGLSVTIPFYYPYPRLVLPWLMAVWIGCGLAFQVISESRAANPARVGEHIDWKVRSLTMVFICWIAVSEVARLAIGSARAWEYRTSTANQTADFAGMIQEATGNAGYSIHEGIVYVYADPAIIFSLKANGLPLVAPVQDFGFLSHPQPRPTFLILWSRSKTGEFGCTWDSVRSQFRTVTRPEASKSSLVTLDDPERAGIATDRGRRDDLILYKVR